MRQFSRNVSPKVLAVTTLSIFLLAIFLSAGVGQAREMTGEGSVTDTAAVANNNFSRATAADSSDGVQRLLEDTNGAARVSYKRATGVASFIRMSGSAALALVDNASAEAQAAAFFARYGDAFGIADAATQLALVDAAQDVSGNTHLTYQQVHDGVEVFAAVMRVHLNAANEITAVNGTFIPDVALNTTPTLSAAAAEAVAVDAVMAQNGLRSGAVSSDITAANSRLYVFRAGLVRGVPGSNHLVYEVEVVNSALTVREFVYVDAYSGKIVDQVTGIHEGLDRKVSETTLGNVVWEDSAGDPDPIPAGWAGGSAAQVAAWQDEIDGASETYHLFRHMTNDSYLSYDGGDATMRTVNNDPSISCPNANWNGTSTNYCNGVTGDDTVAHEWGHAYTEYSHNLIYQWQSGALNESYSDIWGEVVDLLNGRGTDAPGGLRSAGACSVFGSGSPSTDNTYRWLSGEDDPAFGGAIRDLWNPTCYGDPGKVSDTQYWCAVEDGGGVHTNSGVPNHAFALLVDGGTYNGVTVNAIGLTKAAHIYWNAAVNYQGPASNFGDHADALEASCNDLIGVNLYALATDNSAPVLSGQSISAADCTAVGNAMDAVEMRDEPVQCNFEPLLDPNAPALCDGAGTLQSIEYQDWESGLGSWTVGTRAIANPATFDTPDWAVVSTLPDGRAGSAAFVQDPVLGDCSTDIEAGVLYLESPEITVPGDVAVPRVAFDHWVATEAGWDGGNLKISVNGGAWTLVPTSAYEFNAYNSTLNPPPNDNPMAGEPAFTGTDGGSVGGSWGQSQVDLTSIAAAGDTVQFRFEMGLDGCNGVIGWYVDDVNIYACSDEVSGACGNGILDTGETCDDGNSDSGDGCSNVCQVEAGWTCTDPTTTPGPGNQVDDPGFEAGPGGGAWTEFSSNFGTPICDTGSCGTGGGTGPHSGTYWAWFGGIGVYEEGSVEQTVTIPSTIDELTFWLEVPVVDSANDYLEVLIDGTEVYSVDGSATAAPYSQVSVDVSAYADDSTHTLTFHSEIFANSGGVSNFFVDDVQLGSDDPIIEPSVCTPAGVYLPFLTKP